MNSAALGAAIVGQLLAQGVTDFVLAPGSRSTPVALALAAVAGRDGVGVHVRIDERSAGFLALGLAKGSGRPVAVCTTSGTAVGNLVPAVMEAAHGHVPLIVVSADRPASLVGTGANQTTVQVGLFGGFVRDVVRVASADEPRSWPALVARAEISASGRLSGAPGPVQINAEFAEPLVSGAEVEVPRLPPVVAAPVRAGGAVELAADRRTVIVAGDAPVGVGLEALAVATVAGLPLIAEPSSNARRPGALACGRLLLDTPLGAEIERVLVCGHPTLSRPVTRLLSRPDVEVVAVTPDPTWPDPTWRVGQVARSVRIEGDVDLAWADRWQDADARLAGRLVDLDAGVPTGRLLAAAVSGALGSDDVLVVGSSAIVRDLDLAPISTDPPVVVANRGLAGIDGLVSTAVGVALGAGAPTTLLCGDLTFLHDSNGLLGGHGPKPDLRIVVADDDGGSIFATLEPGALPAAVFEPFFATPHGRDLVALAAGFGVPARRVDLADLSAVLAQRPSGVEVVVVPVDRTGARARSQRLAGLARDLDV